MISQLLCLMPAVLMGSDDKPRHYPRPELLLEAPDLQRPANAARFRILDARPKAKYESGHVPGAIWIDQNAWSRAFYAGQEPKPWSGRIGELGIDPRTPVVVYDDGSVKDAARIWWILRYWGFQDARLLNGGWPAWQAAHGAVSRDVPAVAATSPRLSPLADRLAKKGEMLDWLRDHQHQIIDTRSEGEYCGVEHTAKRNGAMPGAIHLEWVNLLDKEHRFKSADELAKLFQDAGIHVDRPAVAHCQSGGRAAVMAFALELMGAKDVRNYYRSWSEWGNADDTPVVKPNGH
jgi:thiosulfate/3-mercaptopyruvate sulfurtransferase